MPIARFVVRPSDILTTPKLLAGALGSETRRWPANTETRYNFYEDVFLTYPSPDRIDLSSWQPIQDTYALLRTFFTATKAEQRRLIVLDKIPVPMTCTNKWEAAFLGQRSERFIVRPMRHREGKHYRITNDPTDFVQGNEYISELFPKEIEYRVIFIHGDPVVWLYKHLPVGINKDGPWGYDQGAYFLTLRDPDGSPLVRTGVVERLMKSRVITHAHIVGVDILVGRMGTMGNYTACVTEFNACPSLAVPALSVEKRLGIIKDHIRKHRS